MTLMKILLLNGKNKMVVSFVSKAFDLKVCLRFIKCYLILGFLRFFIFSARTVSLRL